MLHADREVSATDLKCVLLLSCMRSMKLQQRLFRNLFFTGKYDARESLLVFAVPQPRRGKRDFQRIVRLDDFRSAAGVLQR